MTELKKEATELGLDFKGNISKAELTKLVEEAKNQTADDSSKAKSNTVKIRVTPRDPEEKDGYVGFNGYTAQYQFDTDIEMPANVVNFIKSKGTYVHDGKGNRKWQSRYIVEYL